MMIGPGNYKLGIPESRLDFDNSQFWNVASRNEAFLEFVAPGYSFDLYRARLTDNLKMVLFLYLCPKNTCYADQDQN